ncbi:hypothetical protein KKE45_03015 [Patescibacteria group bacterium]|nr:hypothetical protein [Patescibacteria group bacterium]
MKKRVLFGLLCLVVVGVGVFIGLKIIDKKGDVAGIKEEEGIMDLLSMEERVETVVYENKTYGYRFEYPSSWNRTVLSDVDDVTFKTVDGEVIHVLRQSNYKGRSVDKWLEESFSDDFVSGFEINEINGYKVAVNGEIGVYFVLLPTNEILTISYNSCETSDCSAGEKNIDEFLEMLESLEFFGDGID